MQRGKYRLRCKIKIQGLEHRKINRKEWDTEELEQKHIKNKYNKEVRALGIESKIV